MSMKPEYQVGDRVQAGLVGAMPRAGIVRAVIRSNIHDPKYGVVFDGEQGVTMPCDVYGKAA